MTGRAIYRDRMRRGVITALAARLKRLGVEPDVAEEAARRKLEGDRRPLAEIALDVLLEIAKCC